MSHATSPAASGPPVRLDGRPLSIDDIVRVARHGARATLDEAAVPAIDAARRLVADRAVGPDPIYGLNTGFGSLSRERIDPAGIRTVQVNLVRSHAAGVGEPLEVEVVRAMMLLLAASLARGRSGARRELIDTLLSMLAADIHPVVPSIGSVGASGDLAPLAHVAMALIGEGEVLVPGGTRSAADAMSDAGITPIVLEAKEGLALLNGTHLMAGLGALLVADSERLLDAAIGAAAMSVDACRATDAPFDARIHEARGQLGQIEVAAAVRALIDGSEILADHRVDDPRVQDPYCLRCIPQVLGAVSDALAHVRTIVTRELGAVTDNPLVFVDGAGGDIVSGGNFHGMPLAIALDHLAVLLVHLAGISERRTYWILSARDPENPVQPYLSRVPGLQSGLMIAQYTAAACCNELQQIANPASVGNVPTSAGIEDYNSFGPAAAFKARRGVERARAVVAIEYLAMAEGLDCQRPLRSGAGVERRHAIVRAAVSRLQDDRPPSPDIEAISALIAGGALREG